MLADGRVVRCNAATRAGPVLGAARRRRGLRRSSPAALRASRRRRRRSRFSRTYPWAQRRRRDRRLAAHAAASPARARLRPFPRAAPPDGALTLTASGALVRVARRRCARCSAPLFAAGPARTTLRGARRRRPRCPRRARSRATATPWSSIRAHSPTTSARTSSTRCCRAAAIAALVAQIERWPGVGGGGHEGGVQLDALGGAVNRAAAGRDRVRPPRPADALRLPELLGRRATRPDGRRVRAVDARHPGRAAAVRLGRRLPELHRSRARPAGSTPTTARTSPACRRSSAATTPPAGFAFAQGVTR